LIFRASPLNRFLIQGWETTDLVLAYIPFNRQNSRSISAAALSRQTAGKPHLNNFPLEI
jgi:hypothetical protein